MNERKILIIEDDENVTSTLALRLRSQGYDVVTAVNATQGLEKSQTQPVDLIILDIMLPDRSGLDLCREFRRAGITIPILFLTARTEPITKVVGLTLGADDYVTKPFEAGELLARIEALLRRTPSGDRGCVYQFGNVLIDTLRAEVTKGGNPIHLTAHEFALLCYLMERPDTIVSREELLTAVWGYGTIAVTRTIDKHIATLRAKLEARRRQPELILTVEGFGYKFVGSRDS